MTVCIHIFHIFSIVCKVTDNFISFPIYIIYKYHKYIHIYNYINIYKYIFIIYICIYMYIYIYIYVYMYVHAHKINKPISFCERSMTEHFTR